MTKLRMMCATLVAGELDAGANMIVDRLSGGWRMKLALARAMCLNADILLMVRPCTFTFTPTSPRVHSPRVHRARFQRLKLERDAESAWTSIRRHQAFVLPPCALEP